MTKTEVDNTVESLPVLRLMNYLIPHGAIIEEYGPGLIVLKYSSPEPTNLTNYIITWDPRMWVTHYSKEKEGDCIHHCVFPEERQFLHFLEEYFAQHGKGVRHPHPKRVALAEVYISVHTTRIN